MAGAILALLKCSKQYTDGMKRHTRIYMDFFNYQQSDFIGCEICNSRAVDIHHIDARGMGGSTTKDTIENLMALCRECHIEFGDRKMYKEELKEMHLQFIHKRSRLN
jgi:5-methylcytosine-specific restriction endonuclease McrA